MPTQVVTPDSRSKDLIQQGDLLFSERTGLMSLWQEIADNFYPERADFTTQRYLGTDFAAHLNSSYPILVRSELGDSIGSMTRRKDTQWANVSVKRVDLLDNAGREWLEFASGVQRSAMYDQVALFERSTRETDHDYATFGQGIISCEINWKKIAMLYRSWHPRDVAWCEDEDGQITDRHHNVRPTAAWLAKQFGEDKLHQNVKDCLKPGKNKYQRINCRRIVIPADNYDDITKGRKLPWVSIYLDLENQVVIDERPVWNGIYIIPRWQTVSGSQYAFSPAAVAGLPDARLIQAMTLTLLEAGEMAVRPPVASRAGDVIQGETQIFAGGVTMIDAAYDERLGKAVAPIFEGSGDVGFGVEILERTQQTLARAFRLNKLRALPPRENMTAYEASQHVKDFIREATPIFTPLESEYNAPLCEQTFEDLMRAGAFGPNQDIPQSIRGRDTEWTFESPLTEAIEREKGQKFIEAKGLIAEAVALDPASSAIIDARIALREALAGIKVPAKWMRSEQQVELHARQMQEQQAEQAETDQGEQQAAAAANAGKAVESFAKVA